MRSFLDAKAMRKRCGKNCKTGRSNSATRNASKWCAAVWFSDWNTMAATQPERDDLTQTGSRLTLPLPAGWSATGRQVEAYEAGVAKPAASSQNALFIRSRDGAIDARADAFCAIQQVVFSRELSRQRVEFSAALKCAEVTGSATIWMRVEDINGTLVAFDNLERAIADSSLKGTNDWSRRKIVLFVPEKAEVINFGVYLNGKKARHGQQISASSKRMKFPPMPGNLKPKEPKNLDLQIA